MSVQPHGTVSLTSEMTHSERRKLKRAARPAPTKSQKEDAFLLGMLGGFVISIVALMMWSATLPV